MKDLHERSRAVYHIAKSKGYNDETAEDFAQESCVKSLRSKKTKKQTNYQTFVDLMRDPLFGNHTRSGYARNPTRLIKNFDKVSQKHPAEYGSESEAEYAMELHEILQVLVHVCNPRQLRIVILYFFCGWKLYAIAQAEKSTEAALSKTIGRVIQSLRAHEQLRNPLSK